jgi:hypothetical protein
MEAKQDAWLANLTGMAAGLPLMGLDLLLIPRRASSSGSPGSGPTRMIPGESLTLFLA